MSGVGPCTDNEGKEVEIGGSWRMDPCTQCECIDNGEGLDWVDRIQVEMILSIWPNKLKTRPNSAILCEFILSRWILEFILNHNEPRFHSFIPPCRIPQFISVHVSLHLITVDWIVHYQGVNLRYAPAKTALQSNVKLMLWSWRASAVPYVSTKYISNIKPYSPL